jgi:hypothetical protein
MSDLSDREREYYAVVMNDPMAYRVHTIAAESYAEGYDDALREVLREIGSAEVAEELAFGGWLRDQLMRRHSDRVHDAQERLTRSRARSEEVIALAAIQEKMMTPRLTMEQIERGVRQAARPAARPG